jgi:cardiolipin synthase
MAADFLPGNRIDLLDSGREYFPALLAEINGAQREIYLESYIFADDPVGHSVAEALAGAAQRGVLVNLAVDGFGGRNFVDDFLPELTRAGVKALLYRREVGRFRLRRHRLRRLHRKLAVIDARVAFVGGINIVDDDNTPAGMNPRYDYAIRVEGPLVGDIHRAVRHLRQLMAWASFRRRLRQPQPAVPLNQPAGKQEAAFLIRDNLRHRNDILNAYLAAINSARDEILIANAYFLPGVRFGRALYDAARRGVRITVLLQGKTDHPLLQSATQMLYATLLNHGIRVFEYEKSFMHAKVAVIDGEWATVGSSNIDPFSLLLSREANVFVRDRDFAHALRQSIRAAMADGATEMQPEALARQPFHTRLLRWLSYGLVRMLVGMTGYGPKHWWSDEETGEISD